MHAGTPVKTLTHMHTHRVSIVEMWEKVGFEIALVIFHQDQVHLHGMLYWNETQGLKELSLKKAGHP